MELLQCTKISNVFTARSNIFPDWYIFALKPDLNVWSICDDLAGDRNVQPGVEVCKRSWWQLQANRVNNYNCHKTFLCKEDRIKYAIWGDFLYGQISLHFHGLIHSTLLISCKHYWGRNGNKEMKMSNSATGL